MQQQQRIQEAFDHQAILEPVYEAWFFSGDEAIRNLGDEFVAVMPYALIEGPDVFLRVLQGAARAYKHVHAYAKYEQLRNWTRIGLESFTQDSPEHQHICIIDQDIRRLSKGLF